MGSCSPAARSARTATSPFTRSIWMSTSSPCTGRMCGPVPVGSTVTSVPSSTALDVVAAPSSAPLASTAPGAAAAAASEPLKRAGWCSRRYGSTSSPSSSSVHVAPSERRKRLQRRRLMSSSSTTTKCRPRSAAATLAAARPTASSSAKLDGGVDSSLMCKRNADEAARVSTMPSSPVCNMSRPSSGLEADPTPCAAAPSAGDAACAIPAPTALAPATATAPPGSDSAGAGASGRVNQKRAPQTRGEPDPLELRAAIGMPLPPAGPSDAT
mmetsp:Transcript_103347/g.287814  ORF Transcript_103347/g.287814 Transcript_103347/m.287814 type:complete len:270 (+) Transcript_103347:198-1007(+)